MKPCKITVDLYNTFRERMPEYVQYDRNVPLEITVLENGKPADLNGLFGRLLVSKPDGHEVYSNDVEISGNVITTILGEQVFTASGVAQVTVDILDEQNSKRALIPFGMRIRSAVITDESIKSSNDYQTITALISDVRALDAMFHVEQEQRAEAFNVQMQSQEATFTEAQRQFLADHREAMFHVEQQMTEQADMFHVEQTERAKAFEQSEADREQRFETQTTEWAQTVEQAEATRQFNEERRQSAESKRESAEKARESAERQRVDTEAVRQRQEQERGQGEAGRATAEANRVKAEQTRVDNESSRKSAESSRVNAESQRATAESHRVTAETSRANAESQRATAETNRAGAEGRRSEAESNRVTAENNRATAESNRATAESARETQENARREAEEDRATRMTQWEAKAEETAQKAQEAVDSAQAFVNTNEERLLTDRDKIDYWGNHHANMKDMTDATVDKILGDFNILNHTGEYITATETIARHVPRGTLKGHTEVNCIQEPSGSDIVLPYDFEPGCDVTINDTKETGAVGIELQGQTLVNLDKNTYPITKWGTNENSNNYFVDVVTLASGMFKPATKYLFKIYGLSCDYDIVQLQGVSGPFSQVTSKGFTFNKNGSLILQSSDSIQTLTSYTPHFRRNDIKNLTEQDKQNFKMIILEYQEGMENWDIPYFEGMTSVKAPVLTTTGKNLWNTSILNSIHINNYYQNTGLTLKELCPDLVVGETYIASMRYDYTGQITGTVGVALIPFLDITNLPFTYTDDLKDCLVYVYGGNATGTAYDFQIEKGSVATSYEPHKSSILSLPEEVVLRSLPNGVCDTFNTRTGVYTQRIGERTLDGSESWHKESTTATSGDTDTTTCYYTSISDMIRQSYPDMHCDKLPIYKVIMYHKANDYEGLGKNLTDQRIFIRINQSRLDTQDTNGFKQWLSQNMITIQYPLETPIVTKVPLSQVLKSWNTLTHINTSVPENSLKPIIAPVNPSYEVMLKPSTQYSIITNPIANGHTSTPIEFNLGGATAETVVDNGCTLITTPSTLTNNKLEMGGRGQKLQGGVMVLEGNKTGMMFSHFDGMKSVENPTVRVNNANLVDKEDYRGQEQLIIDRGSAYKKFKWLQLKPNTRYTFTMYDAIIPARHWNVLNIEFGNGNEDVGFVTVYNQNNWNSNSSTSLGTCQTTFRTSATGRVRFSNYAQGGVGLEHNGTDNYDCLFGNLCSSISLQTSDGVQSHVPQESNSLPLTIPMRSLPDGTCDTLNLLTGEYVRNIQEHTFGNESWSIASVENSDFYHIFCKLSSNYPVPLTKEAKQIHIEGLPSTTKWPYRSLPLEAFYQYSDTSAHFAGALLKSRFTANHRAEITEFMSGRKVYYQLATPIVTHLDLQWEDGKLFAYNGTTHFFVDVEGGQLMPILDIDVPVNLAQRTSRLCAEKEQLEAEKAQLANEVSVLQLRNAMLQGEVATLEQSNKDLQKGQEKLDKDNQELTHAVTIVDEHREEGDLELLSSDFDFELRLMEIEFAVGVPMMANYKGVRNMARTPYDMAKALILGGKYEREEMTIKLDRFEKLGSITADQKAELIALMDAVELTQ